MFNKKKIKELEDRLKKIEKRLVSARVDDPSKYLILDEDAVGIRLIKEVSGWGWYHRVTKEEESTIYFKKGTEPKCDYIMEDIDGKRTYYKNDVEVKIK